MIPLETSFKINGTRILTIIKRELLLTIYTVVNSPIYRVKKNKPYFL